LTTLREERISRMTFKR